MELTIEQAFQKGIAAHKEGKLQDAERLYRSILKSQPNHPDANHNLGVIAICVDKVSAALPLFKNALEANPEVEQFWLSYIDALIKEKQFGIAKQVLERAKMRGVSEERLNTLETQLKSTDQVNEAKLAEQKKKKTKTQEFKEIRPSQEQLASLLAHYQSGRFDEAEKLAISLTQEFPNHQIGWKVLGVVLKQTGRVIDALAAMQKSVQIAPQDAEAHNNLGNTFKELGRLEDAEASLKSAIALNPDYAEAHYNLGITFKELGRLDEAEARYKQAIALKPNYVDAHNNLGNTLRELRRLDEAEASLKSAIELKPDYAEAYNNLGITFKELGRFDEAEAAYKQAIALDPAYAKALFSLGNMLHELGRLEEAEVSYKQAIALKPGYPDAHNNLGNTLKELGRLDEAEARYNQAITLKADFADALYNRSLFLFERGQYEDALKDADASTSRQSKICSLISLYALGRVNEIYERLEYEFCSDPENISLAAFAAFIFDLEKRPTAYNFCQSPMDFIHFSNLSFHGINSAAYVVDIINELEKEPTIWQPFEKTTVNGFQSINGVNLFESPAKKIFQLKSIILNEIEKYYFNFKDKKCLFIENFPSTRDIFGWTVFLKKHGHQGIHIHPGGWLSGVIYLRVVSPLEGDEGAIEFSLNSTHYHNVDSPRLTFQPSVGDIVLFPSSLHHKTIPFTQDVDRIIVSFDLIPTVSRAH